MRPELRSASMAICLPGIASKVKRAATSATRSAPLVMTMNCTNTMMRKISTPTTILPWVIMLPKEAMTLPAKPPFVKISRVEDTLSPRRNNVVMSSREGKMENCNASEMFMVMSRIIMEMEMLTMIRTSSSAGGSGMIKNSTITTTRSDIMTLLKIFFIVSPFFV